MDFEHLSSQLENRVRSDGYKGYDPYDVLNSPLLNWTNMKWPEVIATQLNRRSPINFRPLLGIRKQLNPKSVGLLLSTYANYLTIYKDTPFQAFYKDKLYDFLEMARSTAFVAPDYIGWGYNFDWRNRNFKLPKYSPTSVNTSFMIHGLLDAYAATGDKRFVEMAECGGFGLVKHFNLTELDGVEGVCISYSTFDHSMVHNANLLASAALGRLGTLTGSDQLLDRSQAHLTFSIGYFKEDFSISYGVSDMQSWVDSFHTGFVLEQLWQLQQCGLLPKEHEEYLNGGLQFYKDSFFSDDGHPYYYAGKKGVVDIHSPAEAIRLLSLIGDDRGLCERVLGWTVKHLYDTKRHYFWFRKTDINVNKINYMRWSQVWMLYALSTYLRAKDASWPHNRSPMDAAPSPDPGPNR